MPIIPMLQRRQSISGEAVSVPGNIGAAGLVGESVARAGRTGMAISDDFADIVARQNEQVRKRNLTTVSADLTNKANTFLKDQGRAYDLELNQADTLPLDPAGEVTKRAETFNTALRQHLGADNITDPDLQANIGNIISHASTLYKDIVAVGLGKAGKNLADKTVVDATRSAVENAREGKDPELLMAGINTLFRDHHQAGTYNIEDATKMNVKAQQDITVAFLDYLITKNPIKARQEILAGKYIKSLPAAEYRYYAAKAESLGQAEEKIQKENAAFDAVLDFARNPAGGVDVAKAVVAVETAKTVGEVDFSTLDRETRNSLVGRLRSVDAAQKQQRHNVVSGLMLGIEKNILNYDAVKSPLGLTQAKMEITRLMEDPDNADMAAPLMQYSRIIDGIRRQEEAETKADERIRRQEEAAEKRERKAEQVEARILAREARSEAAQARSEARIVRQEAEDEANANMLARVNNGDFVDIYDPQSANRKIMEAAASLGVPRRDFPRYIGLNTEIMKNNGLQNYWSQVMTTLNKASTKGSDTYVGAISDNKTRIINSLHYYMSKPAELDKSFGDQPITVHNPKLIDLYNKLIEKADKEAFWGYDFSPYLRELPPPARSFTGPNAPAGGQVRNLPDGARLASDGKWYVPDPLRPGKYLLVE